MKDAKLRNMSPEVVLAALYLRGAPRSADPPRKGWPQVLSALRREGSADPIKVLRSSGMTLPAAVLDAPGLLAWAENVVASDAVLTALSPVYPRRWFEAFGDSAPPALWRLGSTSDVEWVGAVGSRQIDPQIVAFMAEIGAVAAALGRGVVSGGAAGCDTAAERAALAAGGSVLRLLPHGINQRRKEDGAVHLSLAAPDEPFSRSLAMERNALIYGGAEATVVGHARLRQGGTWNGAADALRRRLGRIVLRANEDPATRALKALGAESISIPGELETLLEKTSPPRNLFAYERRQEFRF